MARSRTSVRAGNGIGDLLLATRASSSAAWSEPVPITALATAADETGPFLSADARSLYFNLDGDLFVTRRATRDLATADDPDDRWVAVIAPPAGHPLAGASYVVESNRRLDRDRVLVITLD